MLYNKFAVKNKKPITNEQIRLVRKYNPFRVNKRTQNEILDNIKPFGRGLNKIKSIVCENSFSMNYDIPRSFKGIRNSQEVWRDGKGNCIELAINLYTILSIFDIKIKWLVAKNPKGFDGEGIDEIGVHPFLIYNHKNTKIKIEANNGYVKPLKKNGFYIAKAYMNLKEFVAFYLQDGGEDLGFRHKEYDKGLNLLELALKINPNDYTIYCSMGTVHALKQEYENAENCFKKAIKIAPSLIDPHKAYGDYLFDTYKSQKFAVTEYKKSLNKTTNDAQILNSLEKRLRYIGEKQLMKKANRMKESVIKRKEFQEYFNEF